MRLAKFFQNLVLSDNRFEIMGKVTLGLVCFRLKGPNFLSQNLLFELNDSGRIHMVPSMLGHKYVIRFCVNSERATENDMQEAWKIIKVYADSVIEKYELENGKLFVKECPESALKIKRMRFSLSKMVSDPKFYSEKKFLRTPTIFTEEGKYLAKKCSFVQDDEE